jgi:hypothetical protein
MAFHCLKLLKCGLSSDGVESICYIHLKHHPIEMDIQNNLNIMDHYFATTPNHHVDLMHQYVRREQIMKV